MYRIQRNLSEIAAALSHLHLGRRRRGQWLSSKMCELKNRKSKIRELSR